MTDQLLSELRKMRSTRTNLGLLAGMVALILLTVLLNGFVTKKPPSSPSTRTSTLCSRPAPRRRCSRR